MKMRSKDEIAVDLVREMICVIVDQTNQVRVTASNEGNVIVLVVSVAEPDRGYVIGKQGRTITAIRTILKTIGEHCSRRYQVQLESVRDGAAVETSCGDPMDLPQPPHADP